MRSRTALLFCLAALGCGGNGSGAAVTITTPGDVVRVDLLIAPERCIESDTVRCDMALSWDAQPKRDGKVFILDIDELTSATRLANGTFRIDLQTLPTAAPPRRMLFIGYADDAGTQPVAAQMLRDVEIPASGIERWELTLSPIGDTPTPPMKPATDGLYVHTWNRAAPTLSRCAAVETWSGGQVTREFLVPPGDTDCDDVPSERECDPYWFRAPDQPAGPDNASCRTRQFVVPGSTSATCLLGGAPCSESVTASTCSPVAPYHCLPKLACDDTCTANLGVCINQRYNQIASVACRITYNQAGQICPYSMNMALDLQGLIPAMLATTCTNPPSFSPRLTPPQLSNPITFGTLTVEAKPPIAPGAPCKFGLTWSGSASSMQPPIVGAIATPLSNGTVAVLPIAVELSSADPTCANTGGNTGCLLNVPTGDDVLACGRAP